MVGGDDEDEDDDERRNGNGELWTRGGYACVGCSVGSPAAFPPFLGCLDFSSVLFFFFWEGGSRLAFFPPLEARWDYRFR